MTPPQSAGQTVDLQTVPVMQYKMVALPPAEATDKDLVEFAEFLSALSRDGFSIHMQANGHLLMGKVTGLIKLQMDIGRVVLPFAAPAGALRQ